MATSELSCPCCGRRIRRETNLYSHLLTKHHRSELSAALVETLGHAESAARADAADVDAEERPRRPEPITPL